MEWSSIISAVLAGGLAGQLTTLFIGNRFTTQRDFQNWMRDKKFTLFSELLVLVSSTSSPEGGYEKWPGRVRALCQQVHLMYPNGTPPAGLIDAMEAAFQHTYKKKYGNITDDAEFREELRRDADVLRTELAKALHSDSDQRPGWSHWKQLHLLKMR